TVLATGTGLLRFSNVTSLAASAPVSAVLTGNVSQISAGFQDWLVEHTPGVTNDLILAASLTTPSLATPLKLGDGTLVVNGDFQASNLYIQEGTLLFNDVATTAVRLTGGTLGGTGTVGSLASFPSGGVVAPGASTGILTSSNAIWNGSTIFAVELRTNTPGAGYDQLKIAAKLTTGAVNLSNATLQVTALPGFSATNGTQFTIIANDSTNPIVGTFASLPEGALADAGNGVVLRISYVGGASNNVVLTTVTTGV